MIQWFKKLFKKKSPVMPQRMASGGSVLPGPPRVMGRDPLPDILVGLSTIKPVGPPNAKFGGYQSGAKEHVSAKANKVRPVKAHDARRSDSGDSDDTLNNILLYQAINNSSCSPAPEPERGGYSGGGGSSGSWDSGSSCSSSSSSDSISSCSSD